MSRTKREFEYTNEDGDTGYITVAFGPWSSGISGDAPIMVDFQDARWMGIETAEEFQRWFKVALAEAKRLHQPDAADEHKVQAVRQQVQPKRQARSRSI